MGSRKLKREKGLLPSFLFLLLFNFVLLFFSSNANSDTPSKVGLSFISFFQKGIQGSISFFKDSLNSINELKNLKEEHQKTLEKLSFYEDINSNIIELEKENDLLREFLSLPTDTNQDYEPCAIIAKDPSNLFNSFMINKGSSSGIEKGMPIVAYQNGLVGLVGKVIEVSSGSSLVLPLFNKRCFVAARVQESRFEGLVSGEGSLSSLLKMHYVKKIAQNKIQLEDYIITSGMDSNYPKGIFIGRVKKVISQEYSSSLELEIDPIINFNKLEYVYVLKGEKGSVE